jgi:hypothetical protein
MLPSFTATEQLGRFVCNEAQRLSDADRILCRHGHGTNGDTRETRQAAYALNRYIIALFDASTAILIAAEAY